MHETIFCQKTKVLAETFNLRVEQNLVHLGRFLHVSQEVVGVTLRGASGVNCVQHKLDIAGTSIEIHLLLF